MLNRKFCLVFDLLIIFKVLTVPHFGNFWVLLAFSCIYLVVSNKTYRISSLVVLAISIIINYLIEPFSTHYIELFVFIVITFRAVSFRQDNSQAYLSKGMSFVLVLTMASGFFGKLIFGSYLSGDSLLRLLAKDSRMQKVTLINKLTPPVILSLSDLEKNLKADNDSKTVSFDLEEKHQKLIKVGSNLIIVFEGILFFLSLFLLSKFTAMKKVFWCALGGFILFIFPILPVVHVGTSLCTLGFASTYKHSRRWGLLFLCLYVYVIMCGKGWIL